MNFVDECREFLVEMVKKFGIDGVEVFFLDFSNGIIEVYLCDYYCFF